MRRHDWASFAAVATLLLAMLALSRGAVAQALVWLALTAGLWTLARRWSRAHPGPMPHALRWTLRLPRGAHTPEGLAGILEPRPGEELLEIGPGIGIHAIPTAVALLPGGSLDVLDAQQAMLDDLSRRAAVEGVSNLRPRQGDAQKLPYADASFDAVYLTSVLGEVPDRGACLREIRRVLRPAGRLVVGELAFDPDYVRFGELDDLTRAAGFSFERRTGGRLAWYARFRPARG
jgi:SAM-dependent methyltransferase